MRAWPLEWWYDTALDVGLAATGLVLMVAGLDAGGGWSVLGLLAGLLGAWFLVRVALALTGRRRNEALWLTADELVHDSRAGRERVARGQVSRARDVPDTSYLLLAVEGAKRWQRCPRPWRPRGGPLGEDRMLVDCEMTGHRPDVLASWLAGRLSLSSERSGTR